MASQRDNPLPEQAEIVVTGPAEQTASQVFRTIAVSAEYGLRQFAVVSHRHLQPIRFGTIQQIHVSDALDRWVDDMRDLIELGVGSTGTNRVMQLRVNRGPGRHIVSSSRDLKLFQTGTNPRGPFVG